MQPVKSFPSLTAALIVRDSEADLPRCLSSLTGHVDDLVVVDTGSSDGSVDIAKSFGARIGHFDWCDDFAAARNAALSMVETEWVLSVDSDEELVLTAGPSSFADALRSAPEVHMIWVESRDANQGGSTKAGRLFENLPGTTWELPIHEHVVQPTAEGIPPVDGSAGICLLHYGYSAETMTGRMDRNLRILRAHLAKDPDHPASLFYYARECAYAGQYEAGYEAGIRAIEELEFNGPQLADALAVTAWNAFGKKDFIAALELTKEARRMNLPTVWSEYIRALTFAHQGQRSKALEAAERACSLPYPEYSLLNLHDIWTSRRFALRDSLLRGS